MIRSAVDLPQPEGPSRLRNSPRPTSSDMSFSASVPFENVFEIDLSETSGLPASALLLAVASAVRVRALGIGTRAAILNVLHLRRRARAVAGRRPASSM